MEQGEDKLVTCPCCTSNACYESEFTTQDGPVNTWLCMTCGFTSNSTMTEDSEGLKQTMELTADLIKDLRQDHDGLAWFPTCITMPDKGMIFPEPIKGTTTLDPGTMEGVSGNAAVLKAKPDWNWTVVKSIDIPEEEQEKYPDPRNPGTFYKKRMDMESIKHFDKLCFMDAAEEMGMFAKQEVNEG
jgi:hypothetical protein